MAISTKQRNFIKAEMSKLHKKNRYLKEFVLVHGFDAFGKEADPIIIKNQIGLNERAINDLVQRLAE